MDIQEEYKKTLRGWPGLLEFFYPEEQKSLWRELWQLIKIRRGARRLNARLAAAAKKEKEGGLTNG